MPTTKQPNCQKSVSQHAGFARSAESRCLRKQPANFAAMSQEVSRMISDPVPKDTAAGWPRQPRLRRKFKKISCGLLGPACLSRGGGVFADSALGRKDQKPLLQKLFYASFQRVVRLLHKLTLLSLSPPNSQRQKRLESGLSGGRRT